MYDTRDLQASLEVDPGVLDEMTGFVWYPDSTGQMLKGTLRQQGIDTSRVCVREGARTGTSMILVDRNGERRIFSATGVEREIRMEDLPDPIPEGVQAITLASLYGLDNLERDGLEDYLARARKRGILVFADTVYDKYQLGLDGIRHLLPQIDYFLPSLYEAQALTGTDTPEQTAAAFRQLGVKNVLIKCGGDGIYMDASTYTGWVSAMKVDPLDTTGAGDCFVASFLTGIVKGYSEKEACAMACCREIIIRPGLNISRDLLCHNGEIRKKLYPESVLRAR